jgi:site-specific DNA recombinase
VVNEDEAVRVRAIFGLYLEHQALLPVVQDLERRRWSTKRCVTKRGIERGGNPFTKTSLHQLLTNVSYIGKVRYKDEIHDGEQAAIVDVEIWQRVQTLLSRNSRSGGAAVRNQFGALLKGLLHCVPCGCRMVPAHTKKRDRRYRYYQCLQAQKRGWHVCPSKSIPAGEIERHVVDQLRGIGSDPALVRETLRQAVLQADEEADSLRAELGSLGREAGRWHDEIRRLLEEVGKGSNPTALQRLAELQERVSGAEGRASELRARLTALEHQRISEEEVATALRTFDPVWNALSPREQARVVQLLVERVDYDGALGTLSITFHPAGIKALAAEQPSLAKEKRA